MTQSVYDKWKPIIDSMNLEKSNSWNDNISQLFNNQSNIAESNTLVTASSSQACPYFNTTLLPMSIRVAAQTLGESDREKQQRESRNRQGKIDSYLENKEYVEEKAKPGGDLVTVKPLSMPSGQLFYMDFKYGDDRVDKIKKLISGK
jgi:hypothetical protein